MYDFVCSLLYSKSQNTHPIVTNLQVYQEKQTSKQICMVSVLQAAYCICWKISLGYGKVFAGMLKHFQPRSWWKKSKGFPPLAARLQSLVANLKLTIDSTLSHGMQLCKTVCWWNDNQHPRIQNRLLPPFRRQSFHWWSDRFTTLCHY